MKTKHSKTNKQRNKNALRSWSVTLLVAGTAVGQFFHHINCQILLLTIGLQFLYLSGWYLPIEVFIQAITIIVIILNQWIMQ